MAITPSEGVDSSVIRINSPAHPSFYSVHSHRFIICLLLLLATYFSQANTLGMSTAVVCMVNSTLVQDPHNENVKEPKCAAAHNESTPEFAIPGSFDWSPSEQSWLLSARFYGNCLTVAVSGAAADWLGPDRVLTGGLLLSSALIVLTPPLAHASYYALVGSRVVIGAADSFHVPAINSLVQRWYPAAGEKAVAVSIYSMGFQFAGGFASLFASLICGSTFLGGWPSIFYIFGGTCCAFAVAWAVFGSDEPAKNRWVNEAERSWLERSSIKIKSKARKEEHPTPLSTILRSAPLQSILICHFSSWFATTMMQTFLPLFLRDLGLSIDLIGWLTLTPFIAQIGGKAVSGPLIEYCVRKERISMTNATKLAQTISSVGCSVLLALLAFIPSCSNPQIACPFLIVYGLLFTGSTNGAYTAMFLISPKNMGTISTLTAIAKIAGSLACSAVVNAITAIDVPYKWALVFAVTSIVLCGACIHFLIFGAGDSLLFIFMPKSSSGD
ncbi:hypothetical protein PRIPAC_96535 [Pristionchus pacificus]|uniref:Membrane transporter n=1 Tax=Pristionchus pacificus TaxID=54126 RepID=A0A2A6D1P9_PRIPA|nr:hypothetical protein PRIPAC_96535 [Pristionchus pacificus]|eukprot:PDM84345.1 membrane transporter [Pristionchus pacificus]